MIHGKQFVLAREPFEESGWRCERLSTGYILSWEPGLRVLMNRQRTACLLGYAWQVVPGEPSPEQVVARAADAEEILRAEPFWCGRYLLILGSRIYPDANGCLGVFRSEDAVSSSLALMFRLQGEKVTLPRIRYDLGITPDFIPGEYTECPGVKRLLCNQVLDYTTGAVTFRELLPLRDYPEVKERERTSKAAEYMTCSFRNMAAAFPGSRIYLTLTGGRDSRTSLAAINASGVPFDMCTMETNRLGEGDRKVPGMLAERLGGRHYYIQRKGRAPQKEKLAGFDQHTAGINLDEDRLFYAFGQFDELIRTAGDQPLILIKSNIYENVICYWEHYLRDNERGNGFTAQSLRETFPFLYCNEEYYHSLESWYASLLEDTCNQWIGNSNLYQWELRSGCWLSGIEQSMDMLEQITVVQPANSRVILSLLMGYDEAKRRTKQHQEILIHAMCPELDGIPYDSSFPGKPPGKVSMRLRKLRTDLWIAGHYGPGKAVQYHQGLRRRYR